MSDIASSTRDGLAARRFDVRYDEHETPRIWVKEDVFLTPLAQRLLDDHP